jgi:quercetin dioxygenase-like cupin family protein
MGTDEHRARRRDHGDDPRDQRGHAAGRTDEHPVGAGHQHLRWTIPLKAGSDVAIAQITVNAGGSSGWHSHPGGAIVVVQHGSLTVYRSVGSECQTTTYTAGQAFIERPGEVNQVINTGTDPYVLFVTFPRVPQGASARTDEPDPGTCPGL